jgi:hypothetical protein
MKGDFSRLIYDALKHYAGVLHQQGRVWLDSDWNEDVWERLRLLQVETQDIIGGCGIPEPGSAFQISPNPAPGAAPDDFLIGGGAGAAGRAYVQGILCQNDDPNASYLHQADFPDPPRISMPADGSDLFGLVYLEVWHRLITYLEDPAIREIALGGPDTTARVKTIAQVKVVTIPNSLKEYNCGSVAQFIPGDGKGTLTTLPPVDVLPPDLCRLPDPANYTGRENHFYRVEIHSGGEVLGGSSAAFALKLAADAALGATSLRLVRALTAAESDAAARAGTIAITDDDGQTERASIASISGDTITLTRGLRRAFTVARNATVTGGAARFKWSRDNASFAVAVTQVSADRQTLTVDGLGRDQATQLRQGDLVEISDDASELGPAHGHLTLLSGDPDPDLLTVALADPLPASFQLPSSQGTISSPPGTVTSPPQPVPVNRHLILRRWDGQGTARSAFSESTTPDMDLGDGIHIQFGGSDLRSGDYWQFAARSVDGSIELLTDAPPAGIRRFRCPLAVVHWTRPVTSPVFSPSASSYSLQVIRDCRTIFPPLAQPAIHITGVFSVGIRNLRAALVNDTVVQVARLLTGIDIQCDADAVPSPLSRAVCYLKVQIPSPALNPPTGVGGGATPSAYQCLVIAADVSVVNNVVQWRPRDPAALARLPFDGVPQDRGILAQLVVKGNFVWAAGSPLQFLDGEDFGIRASDGSTALRFPSGDRRSGGDFETWFWLAKTRIIGGPYTYTASVAVPPILRAEGFQDLMPDIVLQGSGGTPFDIGVQVPPVNITVTLPVQITNTSAGQLSDIVLVIDDPSMLNTSAINQTVPGPVFSLDGTGLNYSLGDAPNIFRGVISGDSVTFSGVAIDPPGNVNPGRRLRIMNIRANATAVGGLAGGAQIQIAISTSGAAPLPITNPVLSSVAFVQQGDKVELRTNTGVPVLPSVPAFTFSSSTPGGLNGGLIDDPTFKGASTSFFVQFNEQFASAYRVQVLPPGFTGFGAIRNDETGFDNIGPGHVPHLPGQPDLPPLGVATNGTRLRITFNNIPPEAHLFVTVRNVPVVPTVPVPPPQASFVIGPAVDGSGGTVVKGPLPPTTAETQGFQILPLTPDSKGNAMAVWECVNVNPAQNENLRFGVVIAYRRSVATPVLGTVTANASLAPFVAATALPIGPPTPRFRDDSTPLAAFTVTQ